LRAGSPCARLAEHLVRPLELMQVQIDVACLGLTAKHAITFGDSLEPVVVLEINDVRLGEQLAINPLRLFRPPRGKQRLRASEQFRIRLHHAGKL
jgi:hypothetical protein